MKSELWKAARKAAIGGIFWQARLRKLGVNGVQMADELLELGKACDAAQIGNGWIPVAERLPSEGVLVLVCYQSDVEGRLVRTLLWLHASASGVWHGDTPVTHWQPLPEPPK